MCDPNGYTIEIFLIYLKKINFMKAEEICKELRIDYNNVLNIYMFGSKVYLTDNEYSDSDYVIVYKSSLLPSGSFKDNAITSNDGEIQGVCYSRSGFIDAINNYEITALECIFLPEDKIVQKKMNFAITKFDQKEFSKKIISKASSSWHFATLANKDNNVVSCAKNVYHALRILDFGLQIKEHNKIINYSSMNELQTKIYNAETINYFNPYDYYNLFIELSENIKNNTIFDKNKKTYEN